MRPILLALALALVPASIAWGVTDAPPPLKTPEDITVDATSSGGAVVSYTVEARDPANTVNCDFPSGTTGVGSVSVSTQFPITTTTVTCEALDPSGASLGTKAFTVTVVDQPPVISAPSGISTTTTDPAGAVVTFDATATDAVDGTVPVTCAPASGSTFAVGSTTVTCTATDSGSHQSSVSFTVTVTLVDTVAPVLTTPTSVAVTTENPAGTVVTYTVSATDNIDPSPAISCNPASGSVFAVGTTTVICTATDSSGNSSTASFPVTVTLNDTTPPVLTVPADFTVTTENPGGRTVEYTVSAVDNVDGNVTPSCSPSSGATFAVGSSTVTCTATDSRGNKAEKTFTITVVLTDTVAPVLSGVPSAITREADGPGGTVVNYTAPTATDNLDGPLPTTCSPASGSRFPLGTSTVTCSATDAHGNTGTATFPVTIVDTVPPILIPPGATTVLATGGEGISSTDPGVAGFLGSALAQDAVDPSPRVTNDAPAIFPVGTTTVTFTATDASGNSTRRSTTLTVLAKPAAGEAPPPIPPPPPKPAPPADVSGLTAKAGSAVVVLTWTLPTSAGFDHVTVTRTPTTGGAETTVYTGRGAAYTDRRVRNGVEYRYVVVSFDRAGNRSPGAAVVALPRAVLLKTPRDGASVAAPPSLTWARVERAAYYNVQLFRGSAKVLSVWPKVTRFQLKRTWKFEGVSYRLGPGLYRWYVWPGYGPRSAVNYGPLIGSSSFTVTR